MSTIITNVSTVLQCPTTSNSKLKYQKDITHPGLLARGSNAITPSVSNQADTILHANKEARKWLEDLLHNHDIKDLFGLY